MPIEWNSFWLLTTPSPRLTTSHGMEVVLPRCAITTVPLVVKKRDTEVKSAGDEVSDSTTGTGRLSFTEDAPTSTICWPFSFSEPGRRQKKVLYDENCGEFSWLVN